MVWRVVASRNADEEMAASDHPQIRLFHVPTRFSDEPMADVDTKWMVCSPKTIGWFSAVGYFFGRDLHQELKVPVGLVMSAVDGTRIEPWTPAVGVESVPELIGKDPVRNGKLYNGMIYPLVPLVIRGAIWYQGEGNLDDGMPYYYRMRALIQGWRKVWDLGDFPFYFVQLAPLKWGPAARPGTELPTIWQAQTAAMQIPNTGMAVTNDIGNIGTAHPRNKRDVGKRLALWALAKTYGKTDLVYSGPLYKSMKVEGNKIRITFKYADGGLASRDGKPLTWFAISGANKTFVPAQATIDDNDSVLVWSDKVVDPLAVRFAWYQTAEPNLMNKAGLPASSFRTDDWDDAINHPPQPSLNQ
jgi:sialate O-acetylesterase